ncbi:hypothetical protein ANME2D_01904 [Candidatus Methanoperedens nitroreducens]|uniref:Uncharacterized protein n=1 Tax=Candidatus Methanoperedens nitratireducens TaxID=1392998 RepID=A0A062V7V3_9EURY|nr:hypothetical protein [Candidatus Methanoperedens nitroreducens]KCZ71849.1 hypothetical protein ANME2D_01904 [Candidatus Methanoperedens nitroreducens]MDJ1422176.1 hypothetical protein [Candidatus Methanoperedens sp.]
MLQDSNKLIGKGDYLYDFQEKMMVLYASPNARKPKGKKEQIRIIAKSKNGNYKYPSDNKLLPPIAVRVGNKTLYRFEYN